MTKLENLRKINELINEKLIDLEVYIFINEINIENQNRRLNIKDCSQIKKIDNYVEYK